MTTRKLLDILEGHDSGVWSAIFAPDGRTLISGDWSGKIRCWQLSR
ncbi:MAG: WD40 repeat domain-containing protein [Cyanobacteria bacterium J06636_28]